MTVLFHSLNLSLSLFFCLLSFFNVSQDPRIGFGFALSGGRDKPHPDSGDTSVVVSDVVRNGPAMGRLQ